MDYDEKEHPYIDFIAFYIVEIIYPIYRAMKNLQESLESVPNKPEPRKPKPKKPEPKKRERKKREHRKREPKKPKLKRLKYSLITVEDLKNTTDDALPIYLNSIGFKQSHTLSDTRLAIGYSAFIICAATFYWDYKIGFEETKYYTAAAVAVYTILNGALTFWIWGVEKGTVYVGTKGGRKVLPSPTFYPL